MAHVPMSPRERKRHDSFMSCLPPHRKRVAKLRKRKGPRKAEVPVQLLYQMNWPTRKRLWPQLNARRLL